MAVSELGRSAEHGLRDRSFIAANHVQHIVRRLTGLYWSVLVPVIHTICKGCSRTNAKKKAHFRLKSTL